MVQAGNAQRSATIGHGKTDHYLILVRGRSGASHFETLGLEAFRRIARADMEDIYRWAGADLELRVHAQPGAKRTETQGVHGGALKIRVQARAVEGAANEALLAFLAAALQLPRRRCVLISGETSRHKRVRIERPERALAEQRLREWGVLEG